jgi:ABC-type iron transport system FetAB permease component
MYLLWFLAAAHVVIVMRVSHIAELSLWRNLTCASTATSTQPIIVLFFMVLR